MSSNSHLLQSPLGSVLVGLIPAIGLGSQGNYGLPDFTTELNMMAHKITGGVGIAARNRFEISPDACRRLRLVPAGCRSASPCKHLFQQDQSDC